jgi:putative cardiolipin synthase
MKAFLFFLSLVLASGSARADQIRYLNHSELAMAQLFEDVNNAKSSLDFTYYIWDSCHSVTKILTHLLEKKAKQGVKIRVMLDAIQDEESRQTYTAFMKKRGIDVKYLNVTAKYNPGQNFRSHLKATVVDGNRYITGGRNMADDYYGIGNGLNWQDREVRVEGPSGAQAKSEFDKVWNQKYSSSHGGGQEAKVKDLEKQCGGLNSREKAILAYLEKNAARIVAAAPVDSCQDVKVSFDDFSYVDDNTIRTDDGQKEYLTEERLAKKPTTKNLYKMLSGAKNSLTIENYTYIPAGRMNDLLREKREKKIPVQVYTNSFAQSDEPVKAPHHYYVDRDNKGSQQNFMLSKMGSLSDRWKFTPKGANFMIHSKVFVADKKDTAITSYNFDPRSYHTNLESGFFAKNCPAFAARVEKNIQLLSKPWKKDQSDCVHCQESPQMPVLDKTFYWFVHELL